MAKRPVSSSKKATTTPLTASGNPMAPSAGGRGRAAQGVYAGSARRSTIHRISSQEQTEFLDLLKKKGKPERKVLRQFMQQELLVRSTSSPESSEASWGQGAGAAQQNSVTNAYLTALKPGVYGIIDDRVVVGKARQGLPFAEFQRLAALLELTVAEQAAVLSVTERTMARRSVEKGTLHPLETERLVLLQKLAEHGQEVFEDQGKFNRWLRRPLGQLDGKSPLQYLDMTTGFVVVDHVLGRLEHGVYS